MSDDPDHQQPLAHLLSRVALGDRAAFAQLYEATSHTLLGLAYGVLANRDRAEEVLQEAYVNVWHGAGSYNPALARPMTWLINIVRHKAIDARRSGRALRESTVELGDDHADTLPDADERRPDRLLADSLLRARIDTCMAELAAGPRQAIALAYYRGLVHSEIAAELATPLGTVKAWLRRGMERLRGCLEAAGVQS